jgi:hypothetical protein
VRYPARGLPTAVIPVLVAVAVLGYVAGHSRSQSDQAKDLRTLSSANVVLDYPPGWDRAAGAGGIPGLSIADPTLLAPGGDEAKAGLLVGAVPHGELGPLPRQFVAGLHRLPQTQIVNLVEAQAYRYGQTGVPGFEEMLTIFVIPNPGGDPTLLACYAPTAQGVYMRTCEQAVAGATLVDRSQTYELTPEPTYARGISAAVAPLDVLRVALKRELRPQVSAATARELARKLADGFAAADAALAGLEPSFAAERPQAALAAAILQARDGYEALASAATAESAADYAAAQKRIAEAESDVNWALENFALLGYDADDKASGGAKSQ